MSLRQKTHLVKQSYPYKVRIPESIYGFIPEGELNNSVGSLDIIHIRGSHYLIGIEYEEDAANLYMMVSDIMENVMVVTQPKYLHVWTKGQKRLRV